MDTFENRRWLVLPSNLTGSINFNQVLEASPSTLRYSVDKTETFVKYDVTVEAGTYGRPDIYSPEYPEYTHQPMLDLLATPYWTQPLPTGSIE